MDYIYKQSVIIYFNKGIPNLDEFYELEDQLRKIIIDNEVGYYDGHEIAMDDSDGFLFMYGLNAEDLFKSVKPTLENTPFMKGAIARLEFRSSEDKIMEIDVEI